MIWWNHLFSVCELCGVYGEGTFAAKVAFPYMVAINNLSQFVAMYCLVLFYRANKVWELQTIITITCILFDEGLYLYIIGGIYFRMTWNQWNRYQSSFALRPWFSSHFCKLPSENPSKIQVYFLIIYSILYFDCSQGVILNILVYYGFIKNIFGQTDLAGNGNLASLLQVSVLYC